MTATLESTVVAALAGVFGDAAGAAGLADAGPGEVAAATVAGELACEAVAGAAGEVAGAADGVAAGAAPGAGLVAGDACAKRICG